MASERATILIAAVCGMAMWYAHGPLKGVLMSFVMFLIPQPIYLYEYWKNKKGHKGAQVR